MEKKTLSVRIDLDALTAVPSNAIWRSTQLVAYGFQAADELHKAVNEGRMPDELEGIHGTWMNLAPRAKIDSAVREEFERWCLVNALRDPIEAINWFLEEARHVCAIYQLGKRESFTAEEYFAFEEFAKKFHEYGLPPKLDYLQKQFGVNGGGELTEHLKSINDTRSCLVHRRGVVEPRDANVDGGLRVSWRTLTMQAGNENESRAIGPGSLVKQGEIVRLVTEDHARTFAVGERITFTAQEFIEICLSLQLFVNEIIRSIKTYGQTSGKPANTSG